MIWHMSMPFAYSMEGERKGGREGGREEGRRNEVERKGGTDGGREIWMVRGRKGWTLESGIFEGGMEEGRREREREG